MAISLKNAAAAAVSYVQYQVAGLVTLFNGPDHSDLAKDQLTLRSDNPVRTRTQYGNRRSVIKLVRTVAVQNPDGTTDQKDMKFEISTSVPVGVTSALVKESIARIASLASNEQLMLDVTVSGKTQY